MAQGAEAGGEDALPAVDAARHFEHLPAGPANEVVVMGLAGAFEASRFTGEHDLGEPAFLDQLADLAVDRCDADARHGALGAGVNFDGRQRASLVLEDASNCEGLASFAQAHGKILIAPSHYTKMFFAWLEDTPGKTIAVRPVRGDTSPARVGGGVRNLCFGRSRSQFGIEILGRRRGRGGWIVGLEGLERREGLCFLVFAGVGKEDFAGDLGPFVRTGKFA